MGLTRNLSPCGEKEGRMEKQKIKKLLRLDAQRSIASLQGDTKKYLLALEKIRKMIKEEGEKNEKGTIVGM